LSYVISFQQPTRSGSANLDSNGTRMMLEYLLVGGYAVYFQEYPLRSEPIAYFEGAAGRRRSSDPAFAHIIASWR
jgi:hypothetical protein